MSKVVVSAAVGLLAAAAPVQAGITVYSSQAAFQSAVQPGYYTESFDSAPTGSQPAGLSFVGPGALPDFDVIGDLAGFENTFPFTIPGGSATDVWMGLGYGEVPLLFTVTQGAPTAVAGTFANADGPGNLIAGELTLEVIGQGSYTFPVTAGASVFVGIVADGPITSFRLSATDVPELDDYPVVNDLILANAVPEPTSLVSLGSLLGFAALARRRSR